jgi:hypothetical protein
MVSGWAGSWGIRGGRARKGHVLANRSWIFWGSGGYQLMKVRYGVPQIYCITSCTANHIW